MATRWIAWLLGVAAFWPLGCSRTTHPPDPDTSIPLVRVRLLQDQQQVMVSATRAPIVRVTGEAAPRRLEFPDNLAVPVSLGEGGWRVGNLALGGGELSIEPSAEGSVAVNGQAYRGTYRLVPVGDGKFDVVNHVDVEAYLKSVVSKELLAHWHDEAYKAQAIVARTYALYEWRSAGQGRHWDLYPDQRSQVYGGLSAESAKSRAAVDATVGVVVAFGPRGEEKIFKAYFSACCGGVAQSAYDAFGDQYLQPLGEQNNLALCNASPRFNWNPVVLSKEELTRRIRAWGARKNRAEKDIARVERIDVQAYNRFGRPTRFLLTDARGARYGLNGEELRWAVNTDATDGVILYSSFFKPLVGADAIQFTDGHGWGHAVGMCQWCAQSRAVQGVPHEDIVLAAYAGARLVRAY